MKFKSTPTRLNSLQAYLVPLPDTLLEYISNVTPEKFKGDVFNAGDPASLQAMGLIIDRFEMEIIKPLRSVLNKDPARVISPGFSTMEVVAKEICRGVKEIVSGFKERLVQNDEMLKQAEMKKKREAIRDREQEKFNDIYRDKFYRNLAAACPCTPAHEPARPARGAEMSPVMRDYDPYGATEDEPPFRASDLRDIPGYEHFGATTPGVHFARAYRNTASPAPAATRYFDTAPLSNSKEPRSTPKRPRSSSTLTPQMQSHHHTPPPTQSYVHSPRVRTPHAQPIHTKDDNVIMSRSCYEELLWSHHCKAELADLQSSCWIEHNDRSGAIVWRNCGNLKIVRREKPLGEFIKQPVYPDVDDEVAFGFGGFFKRGFGDGFDGTFGDGF